MSANDTIAAAATPPGRGAIGIIRISGPEVPRIARAVLGVLPAPRQARLGAFLDRDGEAIDRGLALYFEAPHSFTGESVLELQGHGGSVVIDLLLQRLVELGCRLAQPGEFSERAFLNDKLDLAQAEAIADLIEAGTSAAARAAMRTLRGDFSVRVGELDRALTALRIEVEAAIDFPDEEIDFVSERDLGARITGLLAQFDSLSAAAHRGAMLREGLKVVLAGPPNVGKSSLMNALAGEEVAIVTEIPGTTRDLLRENVRIDSLMLTLIDTAGLRASTDPVEREGVRRARRELQQTDRILLVLDVSAGEASTAAALSELPHGSAVTLVFNKIDLANRAPSFDEHARPPRLYVSAVTGAGLDLLRAHLGSLAGMADAGQGDFSARRRHLVALAEARARTESAAHALTERRAFELVAEDLRLAQRSLAEITGEFTSEDLLTEIFRSFCIGK